MENRSRNNDLIAQSYVEHYQEVLNYIHVRVNDMFEAENLTQDVWLKLLEGDRKLSPESIRNYIYSISRSVVNDYLRRVYMKRGLASRNIGVTCDMTDCTTESAIMARDMARFEGMCIRALPERRRVVYVLTRFGEKSIDEIARCMKLSPGTVESQLYKGRRFVRTAIAAIA